MTEFKYEEPFQITKDDTEYRNLGSEHINVTEVGDRKIVTVSAKGLQILAKKAMSDVSFYLRSAHLELLSKIIEDDEATDNDKYVAHTLLVNATVAAKGELPSCQDTGTAIVLAKKGEDIYTGVNDAEHLSKGIFDTYQEKNLRYSQLAPLSMFEEKNTGSNLPAQIDIYAKKGSSYEFLFMAKGGGSANKTFLYQKTKSLLNENSLIAFLKGAIRDLGTAACPPYHLSIVIGGTSAEANLATVKKASAGYFDNLPTTGSEGGRAFRNLEW